MGRVLFFLDHPGMALVLDYSGWALGEGFGMDLKCKKQIGGHECGRRLSALGTRS